jgi:hypothetical protein
MNVKFEKTSTSNSGMFQKMSRSWLIGILLLLPFQLTVAGNTFRAVDYFDEITVALFLPFAIVKLINDERIFNWYFIIILISLTAIAVSGAVSGMVNRNSLLVSALGTFDYLKNFFVIIIYAAFFKENIQWKKILDYLVIVAAILGGVALLQEIWALGYHYMLGNDIYHSGNYILKNLPSNAWQYQDLWRFGIYRASSFMHHSNALGLYFVLVLSMYLFTVKKVNPGTFSLLFIGIFVSVSRIVYTLFLLLGGVQIFKGKRWLTLPAVPILVLCILMSSLPDFDMSQAVKGKLKKEDVHFRMYAKDKAMEVWRDDPLFGVGPGMFGGVVSIIFDSPIYKKHDFSEKWFNYMKPFRSLDQFWPQALAELGVVGTTLIAVLLISIFFTLFGVRKKAKDDDTRNLLAGLALATLMIFVYTMGSGLNDTSFLFTYSAFVGIGLGNENPTH